MSKQLYCHDYREYLPAYINRELPPLLRLQVAVHLEQCEGCYAAYTTQRDVVRELTQQVPLIGRAEPPRLNKIWAAVQGEMARPRRTALSRIPLRRQLAVVLLAIGLFLPSLGFQALQGRQMALALPVPPTPTETIEKTSQSVAVAMATADCACRVEAVSTAVPAYTLPAQPNYAPNLNGTQVP